MKVFDADFKQIVLRRERARARCEKPDETTGKIPLSNTFDTVRLTKKQLTSVIIRVS